MSKILVGFVFVLLGFQIPIGTFYIECIPSFIGFVFLYYGLKELSATSRSFKRLIPFVVVMSVFHLTAFVLKASGLISMLGNRTGLVSILYSYWELVSLGFVLFIAYQIVMGVRDMENRYLTNFHKKSLLTAWKVLAICSVFSLLVLETISGTLFRMISDRYTATMVTRWLDFSNWFVCSAIQIYFLVVLGVVEGKFTEFKNKKSALVAE